MGRTSKAGFRRRNARVVAALIILSGAFATLLVIAPTWSPFGTSAPGFISSMAKWYHTNREDISPIATFLGAAAVAWAALWQAQTARLRHENQSDADYSRRITETLLKASEQLGHEKIEVRLGGIYVLERIARDSEEAYWPVMEALTAFVREKSGLKTCTAQESESLFGVDSDERDESEMSADVAAVVSVIRRRKVSSAEFEDPSNWSLDLAGCNLRRSNMAGAHLCHADFRRTCLEVSFLGGANIENGRLDRAKLREAFFILAKAINASFKYARLEGANFEKANLEGADFQGAHLERSVLHAANLRNANFEDARLDVSNLNMSILDGANFNRAFLRYVDFRGATGLTTDQLAVAHGDATTVLPENLARPKKLAGRKSSKHDPAQALLPLFL